VCTLLALLISAVFVANCSKERPINVISPPDPVLGQAKVKLHVAVPESEKKNMGTKASDSTIDEVYIMTFDEYGNLTDEPQPAYVEVENSGSVNESYHCYVATLNSTNLRRRVVIVANGAAAIAACELALVSGAWVEAPDGELAPNPAYTQLSEVVQKLTTTPNLNTKVLAPSSTTYITSQPKNSPPMSGSVVWDDGIRDGMIIQVNPVPGVFTPVPLIRATSKFTVESLSALMPDFEILGASLAHAPVSGYILPHSLISQPIPVISPRYHYANASSTNDELPNLFQPLVGRVDALHSDTLYCFEHNNILNINDLTDLSVVLYANYKSVPGYYRIDLVDGTWDTPLLSRSQLNIERNMWYKITVTRINHYGYSTLKEAAANKSVNIEYTIEALVPTSGYEDVQDDAHDILTNGNYMLGVSNSIYYAYSDESAASGTLTATTVTHSAPSTVTTARIVVSGTGLSLISPAPTIPSIVEGVFSVATLKFPIQVAMSNQFTYNTTGKITIYLGDIIKEIEVYRRPPVHFNRHIMDDFATSTCVSACSAVEPLPTWVRFSASSNGATPSTQITNAPSGNIYLLFDKNIQESGATERGDFVAYFSQNTDKGRIKANFRQSALNINAIVDTRIDKSYVGAFWRAGETGERMIRIPIAAGSANVGSWKADVVWLDARWSAGGGDGAVVALDGFDAGGLSARGISWSASVTPNDPETFTLTDNTVSVGGSVPSTGGYIEFRIGLQRPYLPTFNHPARYGLVLLSYGLHNNTKTQILYLRQGENPDYLMRPQDVGVGTGFPWGTSGPRPLAQKISPYNLTAGVLDQPVRNNYGSPPTGDPVALFADYPTQTGAYFHYAASTASDRRRYAWNPHLNAQPAGWSNATQSGFWNTLATNHETCPTGYRRIHNGSTSSFVSVNDPINGSELRQSLWYSVPDGINVNTGNYIWGYYADGFFDRRAIGASVNGAADAAVSIADRNVAYIGGLFYNPLPDSYASLFIPATGSRLGTGTISLSGTQAFFLNSSVTNDVNIATPLLTSSAARMNTAARDGGFPIRCVAPPCFALSGVSVTPTNPSPIVTSLAVTLTATYSPNDATTPSWQWERSFDGGTTWLPIPNGTTSSLSARAVWRGATLYRVVVTNCGGSMTSTPVTVTGNTNESLHPPEFLPYVGAFWKNDQTGERLIRVLHPQTNVGADGEWGAWVVEGDSWISLDTDPSTDLNIGWLGGSANETVVHDMIIFDASHPVPGTTTAIYGSSLTSSSDPIYFRIGLRGVNPGIAPRYGMVLLTYSNHERSQRIWIRQGEDSDYLMWPNEKDGTGANVGGSEDREMAQLFSPYNLTASPFQWATSAGGTNLSDHPQLPLRGGSFTRYPSQAGAYFQWSVEKDPVTMGNYAGRAYHPGNPATASIASWNYVSHFPGYWSDMVRHENISELCPKDYRRPNDGITNGSNAAGAVAGSEIRQSLWLNPKPGRVGNSDIQNSAWGYYADGFFDRRQITTPAASGGASLSVVSDATESVAYIGNLFYNPNNNASLFFPATGYRDFQFGALLQPGAQGSYVSSSSYEYDPMNLLAWTFMVSNGSARPDATNRSHANPVRCVYDPCFPILSVSVTPGNPGAIGTGGTVTLTAALTSSVVLKGISTATWHWERSFDGGVTWLVIPNATTSSLNARAVWPGTTLYKAVATNCDGSMHSNSVPVIGNTKEPNHPTGFFPYVGAFWKSNQTGERLIRISRPSSGDADGEWGAWVMVGDTWISLDAIPSSDPNIGWKPGAVESNVHDMIVHDATHPVPGVDIALYGNSLTTSTTDIYFRIGLRGTQGSGAAPRYGMVLLTYNNHEKAQRIWIRQGESEDFLMRLSDAGVGVSYRPEARRFSPYNLTASPAQWSASGGGAAYTNHPQLAQKGGSFTDYPSQAGALFQWSVENDPVVINNYARRAYHPSNPPTVPISSWYNMGTFPGYWTDVADHRGISETCPGFYRRPNDGITDGRNNAGLVDKSEVRQSLWLNPQTDMTSNVQNAAWGYYADGFFDRRQTTTPAAVDGAVNSAVSNGTEKVAYIGNLFFNPYNNASLFFPATGYRNLVNSGALLRPGSQASYLSSSSYSSDLLNISAWQVYISKDFVYSDRSNRTHGSPVRCIYEVGVISVSLAGAPNPATIASTVTLTATVTPSNAENVYYIWQFSDDGSSWVDLGETTTNTFNPIVYFVGPNNHFRVIAYNGHGSSSATTVITGVMPTTMEAEPNTLFYVGAFWRSEQTGERVIRIPVGAAGLNNHGPWTAAVSWLDSRWDPVTDGVVLALGDSPDPNIRHKVNANTGPSSAENYQVAGNANVIFGNAPANGEIMFRIGLKTKYDNTGPTYSANASYPARYAVVLLTYGDGKWQRLFIRQGHDPDYLMGRNDSGTGLSGSPVRPAAVRMSPYNYKDPQNRVPAHRNDVYFSTGTSANAVFVHYPTMVGYLMVWNQMNGTNTYGNPVVTTSINGWSQAQMGGTGWWSTNPAESCPYGSTNAQLSYGGTAVYRRPNDGSTSSAGGNTIANSEMRQSLFLNPPTGSATSFGNSMGGYYADGYFDRGQLLNGGKIVAYNNGFYASSAGGGVAGIFTAAAGRLFFNPTTNASIFFPAGGELAGANNNPQLQNVGTAGAYWTSTANGNGQNDSGYQLHFDSNPQGNATQVHIMINPRASCYSVRCVMP